MNTQTLRRERPRAGFSLVEVALSSLLVGGLLVTAMASLGAALRSRQHAADHATAILLGRALMAEIIARPYQDPHGESGLGPESGEHSGDRSRFDDVDDFHDWSDEPPTDRDGKTLAGLDGWTRRVLVEYVHPDDLNRVVSSDLGVKRITVTVQHDEGEPARLRMVVTESWQPHPPP
ncbi:MAG: type IV pilus modification PilV family protein [Planctomycetaceae bacterium]